MIRMVPDNNKNNETAVLKRHFAPRAFAPLRETILY